MIDKDCAYYKCHLELDDCGFCYCPIYPCKIEKLGEWKYHYTVEYNKKGIGRTIDKDKKIWDCSNCNIMHNKEVTDKIKKSIRSIIEDSI